MIGDDLDLIRALEAWRRLHTPPWAPPAPAPVPQDVWLGELWSGGPCLSCGQMCAWAWPFERVP